MGKISDIVAESFVVDSIAGYLYNYPAEHHFLSVAKEIETASLEQQDCFSQVVCLSVCLSLSVCLFVCL